MMKDGLKAARRLTAGRRVRSFLILMLAAAVWLGAGVPYGVKQARADEANLVKDDFDGTMVGGLPGGWVSTATGNSDVSVQETVYGNNYLRIYDASKKKTEGALRPFPAQTGKVTVEAQVKLPAGGTPGKENILFYLLDSANRQAVSLILHPCRIDTVRETSSGTVVTAAATGLPLHEWRRLTIEADAAAKSFNLYLDGVLKQSGLPFRRDDVSNISTLQITGAYYNEDANPVRLAMVDNVLIYEGAVRLAPPAFGLVEENFDAMAIGSTPEGWGISPAGSSYAQVREGSGSNRYLRIYDTSVQKSWGVMKSFAPQTGKLTIHADVQLPEGATAGKENILFYLLDSSNRAAAALILRPEAINVLRTVGESTASTQVAGGLPLHAWRSLVIAADYETKSFDLYLNGSLIQSAVPFRYDDVQNIAKLQVAGAYYSENASYTRIAHVDNIRIYQGEPDLPVPTPVEPPEPGHERYSFDSYSSVFLSSRWYREGAGGNAPLGTLDVMKRFMVTDDKWTYLTDPAKISNIVRQGISFQGSLNTNLGTNQGRALYFDGTPIVAPWMSWGATWGSTHDPAYYQLALDTGKQIIDGGASGIQFDDWAMGVAAAQFGGDFNETAMVQFREYLRDMYSSGQLAAWGINDINAFHYKTYLQNRYQISTNNEYAGIRSQSPLNDAFTRFQYLATVDFHQRLYHDLLEYAGRPFEYSNNAPFIQNPSASAHYLHDLFSYGMGESPEDVLTLDNIVTNGQFSTGLGKPYIISPVPRDYRNIRQAIAAAYATGQYVLVPWDIWLHGDERYFGTLEEYGDLYHFIREYPFLFDGYEAAAKIGVVIKWEEADFLALRELSMRLFEAGIPFRDIIVHRESPEYQLKAEQLEGLDALIVHTPLNRLSPQEQQLIGASQLPVYTPGDTASAHWLAERSMTAISGDGDLYAALRAAEDEDAPKVVHLLSRSGYTVENAAVTLSDADFFGGSAIEAVLYRPGGNPVVLPLQNAGNGKHAVVIPELKEWGILRIHKASVPGNEPFALPAPWSGLNIGNPARNGAASAAGTLWSLASDGAGFGIQLEGDTGFSDQLSYAYQHLEATPLQSFSITAWLGGLEAAEEEAQLGLMVREAPASNARFIAVTRDREGSLKLRWREADNGPAMEQTVGQSLQPGFARLERQAGVYQVYWSQDGVSWESPLGTKAMELEPRLGGVAVAQTGEAGVSVGLPTVHYGELSLPPGQLGGLRVSGASLRVGEASQLTVTAVVYDNGTPREIDVTREHIAYASSNEEAVAVDGYGMARGLAEGGSVVTAAFSAGDVTVTDSVYVEVRAPSPYLVDEDFNLYSSEQVPEGWSFSPITAGGSFLHIADFPSPTDRSLQVYDNTPSGFPSASINFAPQSGPVVVEMDFRVNFGALKQAGGAIVAYLQAGGSANAVSLLAESRGFWYLDGSNQVVAAPVIEDEWNHIRIVADPSTDKMDLYLNGVQVVAQGNFRSSTGVISKLQIGGSTGGTDTTAYWNNIRVYAADQ